MSGQVLLAANWKYQISYKNQICGTVGASLAALLEPLGHCQNVASIGLFYRYYLSRCSSGLGQLVPLLYSEGRITGYSDRLPNFSVTIPRCYKDDHLSCFFPGTGRPQNFLPKKCCTSCRFFLNSVTVYFNLFVFVLLVTPCLVVQFSLAWSESQLKKIILVESWLIA